MLNISARPGFCHDECYATLALNRDWHHRLKMLDPVNSKCRQFTAR
jgi:hypothetical protein